MRKFTSYAALAACGLLVGCGNTEPSAKDIQSAIQHYMMAPESKVIDDNHIALDGEGLFRQYISTEKMACKTGQEAPGAVCDFQLSMCVAKENATCEPKTHPVSGRFVKSEKGWSYMPIGPDSALPRPVEEIQEMANDDIMTHGGIAGSVR